MRHQKKKVTLDRKVGPRTALLMNLATSFILYEKIKTTRARAKATRSIVEKIITKAKLNTLVSRRAIAAMLKDKNAVKKAVEVLAPRYKDRAGGFTRTTALGNRKGDGAPEVVIEFV